MELYPVPDIIHEVIENRIPIYNRELLEVAMFNVEFACQKSGIGPAYNEDTPINHIISNIYVYLRDRLHERYQENKK